MAKKLFIKTYGCQMNVYDSDRMGDLLARHGYRRIEQAEDADLVILNTCHIREKAAEKVYSELGRLRQIRERRRESGSDLMIGVAGCVAQAEGKAMIDRAPFVDLVVGPQTYHRLPEMLHRRARGEGTVLDTDFPLESKFDLLPDDVETGQAVSAFLTVQEGCDKFCTFCVVPYTRGAEASRPVKDIIAEATRLVRGGVREITLLGQNVNAYHGEGLDGKSWSLARLIQSLADIEGLWRIRYTTSHPRDMSDDLIEAHGTVPALMPFLHLPVQSGSDRVLKRMNRQHDADTYRGLVEELRRARPDLALSSDFIVGFPGETDADFEATMQLVDDVQYAQAFSFRFSPRPGTPASKQTEQVKDDVKSERLARLQALLSQQTDAFNQTMVGKRMPILLERTGRHPGQLVGRSPYLQAVHVEAPGAEIGDLIDVDIADQYAHSLAAKPTAVERDIDGSVDRIFQEKFG
ncbi:MAG: tRNA (N6-isopentenyl adenosine(37)-C2)-methylthiotransferase MiaB [Geminicoccaceae bacterium]